TEAVAQFSSAAWSQGNHFVGEMGVVVVGFVVTQTAKRLENRALRLGLAGVDDVIKFGPVATRRGVPPPVDRRDPALVVVRIAEELAVSEVASQQAELPHVVSDILPDIADRAVGTNDDFLILFRNAFFVRAFTPRSGTAHDPAALVLAFRL